AHSGRTPPCAKSLAEAGIARVVIACVDPYPPVRGRGIAILRRAGVSVTVGVMEKDARALNAGFITRVTRGRPLVVLKLAMSLDGKIAASSGDSKWISSAKSRDLVHRWRSECDAVMVGAGTVIADNPRLTSRVAGGRDPIRVVVDGRLRTPADARVYRIESKAGAILVTTRANLSRARRKYARSGVEVLGMPAHRGEIDLMALMREFGRRGWRQVMLEGGAHLAGSALAAGIVDRIALFVAPRIIGDGIPAISGLDFRRVRDSIQAADLTARQVDSDWLFEGRIAKRR
ncbi:MAG: bifunctional diaminohydroxyphosphoribosylaminopyrimidine deaminase/5-amino-6-(5-phosphoribosylamino)uracil reductase RibD, partial [Candidatus Binataceae bacterium]